MKLAAFPYGSVFETVREKTGKERISARGLKEVRLKLGCSAWCSKHKNARMEISEHGKIVWEDFSRGGLYVVRTWKDCKGIGMTLMWEEKTRTGD